MVRESKHGCWAIVLLITLLTSPTFAQGLSDLLKGPASGGFDGLSGGFGAMNGGGELELFATLKKERGSRRGQLTVTASMTAGWHVYSTTQPRPFKASIFAIEPAESLKITGAAVSQPAPTIKNDPHLKAVLEEHYDKVRWTLPVQFADGVDPKSTTVRVIYSGQVCHDEKGCIPVNKRSVPVVFQGEYDPVPVATASQPSAGNSAAPYRVADSRVTWLAQIEPKTVVPGQTAQLHLTATPEPNWHMYAYVPDGKMTGVKATIIEFSQTPSWRIGSPMQSVVPQVKPADGVNPAFSIYQSPVTFTVPLQVPADAAAGGYALSGVVGFQTCSDDQTCLPPTAIAFSTRINVGSRGEAGVGGGTFDDGQVSRRSDAPGRAYWESNRSTDWRCRGERPRDACR